MSSLFLSPVSSKAVSHIIMNLKNTLVNHNELPVRILKQVSSLLAEAVSQIINKFFPCGTFPDILKLGKIVPIFKSGDTQKVFNYRPISILPIFSKIIELSI